MRPYGRQILICQHGRCAPPEEAIKLQSVVRENLGTLRKLRNPERVKCTLTDCLGVCAGGPIVTVYPDGVWYHHVTPELMEKIVQEHIAEGRTADLEEHIFHRLYPTEQTPNYAPDLRGDAGSYDPETNSVRSDNGETAVPEKETIEYAPAPDADDEENSRNDIDAEARRQAARRKRLKKGLVIVNTGEGKGKTTAALGVMTRAWGRNMRVGLLQFLKHEKAKFGEIKAAEKMGIERIGLGDGWTWTSKDMDETEARARAGWEKAKELISTHQYDVLIMDEFTYPLHYNWLNPTEVITWLKENKPEMMHLIITGRYATPDLVAYADLVTEMRNIKHPFDTQGIRAQAGIEF